MFGFYNVFKPAGPTSHDIVDLLRGRLGRQCKVGHAGTLDPFAEGVLVMAVGAATRLVDFIQAQPKAYRAEFTLGATSSTDDPTGEIQQSASAASLGIERIDAALARFVGNVQQAPPAHSAVHIDGQRAYRLARAGHSVDLPTRGVRIYQITRLEYAWPRLVVEVRCGAGTYIRSLARDLGVALGVGGYCSALLRSAVGSFSMKEAKQIEELNLASDLLDPLLALAGVAQLMVTDADLLAISQGKRLTLPSPAAPGPIALLTASNELAALAVVSQDGLSCKADKVFPPAIPSQP